MSLAILGINHKTTSVALREKVVFSPENLQQAFYSLYSHPLINGCVILSTCNRTELYLSFAYESDLAHAKTAIQHWLCQFHQLQLADYNNSFYWHTDFAAVQHLMKVACGIDSLILGEPQILGQVKQAFHLAQQQQTLSPELDKLFQKVFNVAKRVRTETQIGSNTASVAYAACLTTRTVFKSVSDLSVMLIGAGETIELIARYLKPHGFNKIIVANRTREKALKLTQNIEAEIISLPEIANRLPDVDIVFSSTASPLPIIGKGMVERSLKLRQYRPMLFVDLAVPRDVEAEVAALAEVKLYTVDDLQDIIQQNIQQREIAAKEAAYIIDEQAEQFMAWLRSRQAIEAIKLYRQQASEIKQELTTKARAALEQGADVNEIIEVLSHRLTNRLIHAPTQSLLQAATCDTHCLKFLTETLNLKHS